MYEIKHFYILFAFQLFQESQGEKGQDLEGTISFLQHSSKLVEIFNDLRPIRKTDDPRLTDLEEALLWFEDWERESATPKDMLSRQTQEDIKSMLAGFLALAEFHFQDSTTSLVPGRINNDIVENFFCQQRTLVNGANRNPTARDYAVNINPLVLCQAPMSRKRNSFGQTKAFINKI